MHATLGQAKKKTQADEKHFVECAKGLSIWHYCRAESVSRYLYGKLQAGCLSRQLLVLLCKLSFQRPDLLLQGKLLPEKIALFNVMEAPARTHMPKDHVLAQSIVLLIKHFHSLCLLKETDLGSDSIVTDAHCFLSKSLPKRACLSSFSCLVCAWR